MKPKDTLFIVLILFVFQSAFAQSTFIPKDLGSNINSAYDDILPVISNDGKTLYFTRLDHPENTFGVKKSADIWFSRWQNGHWSPALRLTSLNTGHYNSLLSITNDGQVLIYGDKGLSVVTKTDDTWGVPQPLTIKGSKDATLSADGKHLLYSKGGKIYIAEKSAYNVWQKPVAIKTFLVKKQTAPFLLADNKTLYFSGEGKNKLSDIYKATRTGEDWSTWTTPVALNDTINTAHVENYFKTNSIGSWAYYTSADNATSKADIYTVKVYEDNPFVLIKGKVINAVTKRPLRNKKIAWLANGKPVDSVKLNPDSATFRVKLPLRNNYSLVAQVDHYKPYPFSVEALNVKEYTVINTDIEEGPVSYALLKGKLLVKNTDQPIPSSAKPTIVVDGEAVDSARIEIDGSYVLKLKHGASYYVQVSAKRFESFPALVELDKIDGYEEIVLDLQADAEKMAIVTGKIIDKKTGKPLDPSIHAAIQVEGISSVYAIVDSLTGAYEVRLPLHADYSISVSSDKYYPVAEAVKVTNENNEVKISQDLLIVPIEKGQDVALKGIYFEPGKTTLSGESTVELDRLVAFLTNNPKARIDIYAYTYKSIKLSTTAAAKAVLAYLVSGGISPARLTSHGAGSARPINGYPVESGKQNIKVDFVFLGL